jgi:hypothetical protein
MESGLPALALTLGKGHQKEIDAYLQALQDGQDVQDGDEDHNTEDSKKRKRSKKMDVFVKALNKDYSSNIKCLIRVFCGGCADKGCTKSYTVQWGCAPSGFTDHCKRTATAFRPVGKGQTDVSSFFKKQVLNATVHAEQMKKSDEEAMDTNVGVEQATESKEEGSLAAASKVHNATVQHEQVPTAKEKDGSTAPQKEVKLDVGASNEDDTPDVAVVSSGVGPVTVEDDDELVSTKRLISLWKLMPNVCVCPLVSFACGVSTD